MIVSEKVEKVIRPLNELSAGWQKATLAEVAEIIMGQSPSSQYYNSGGEGLPFFQGKAEFGELYPKPVKWCSKPNKVAQKDDILMTVRAPVGPTNLAITECCIGRGLAAIRPRNGVSSRYVLYYLRSIESGIDALGAGTTFKAISGGILRSIPIPIAPAAQQDRIVAEIEKQFSRLDEAVANLKRVKANLKRYKAAVLKAAVEGKLTEDWREQHPNVEPASKLLERILSERRAKWSGRTGSSAQTQPDISSLPELPNGWVWVRLDTIAALKGGITVDKSRKSSTARPVPYLRVANVQRGYLDLSEVKEIEAPDADIKDLCLIPGDILFNEGGDRDKLGRGWLWEGQLPECIHQNHVFRARLYLAEVSPKLVSWWGNTFGQAYFLREGKQTTNLASLNLTKLSAFPIPLPSPAEQQQITAEVERRLSVIEELEAAVQANLTRADRLRQAILSQAFSGRLLGQDTKHIQDIPPTFSIAAESQASYGRTTLPDGEPG